MRHIKRKRDRREYDLKRALESYAIQRPGLMLNLNREAIDEEIRRSTEQGWAISTEPLTIRTVEVAA